MNALLQTHPNHVPGAAANGRGTVFIFLGGSFPVNSRFITPFGGDFGVYADVPTELNLVRAAEPLIKLPLAEGETMAALGDGGSARLKKVLEHRHNIPVEDGLGQVREVGAIVASKVIQAHSLDRFLDTQVWTPLLIKHNCWLEHADLWLLLGSSGGTGGPGALPIGRRFAQHFLESGAAKVRTRLVVLGPLTFCGLGERIGPNAAAAIAEFLDYCICNRPPDPRESRSLILLDLPPYGSDKLLRDAAVAHVTQALLSKGVQEELERGKPNRAFDTPLGPVTIIRPWLFPAIPTARIAAHAALTYREELEQVAGTGHTVGVVDGIAVGFKAARFTTAGSVADMVDRVRSAKGRDPDGLFDACTAVAFTFDSAVVSATVRGAKVHDLAGKVRVLGSEPCHTAAGLIQKFGTLQSADAVLRQELDGRAREIRKLTPQRDQALSQLKAVWKHYFPRGLLQPIAKRFADPSAMKVRLENAIGRCRDLGRKFAKLQAEHEALQRVHSQLDATIAQQQARVRRVTEFLSEDLPCTAGGNGEPPVEVVPLDAVLDPLFQSAAQSDRSADELLELLGSTAARVTLPGLMEITQAAEPTAAGVAARLVTGATAAAAPYWGGHRPAGRGRVMIVLPPLAKPLEEELRNEVRALDAHVGLTCADTARAGVTVVRLEVYRPASWDELFTPPLRKHLKTAIAGGPLFFPDGTGCLTRLDQVPDVPGAKLQEPVEGTGAGEIDA